MFVVILKGDLFGKILVYSCIVSWILYYIAVESGYYSYGHFAERYGLCLLPLWIITLSVCAFNIYQMVLKSGYRLASFGYICLIFVLCAVWCAVGWKVKIEPNWEKENNRSVVAVWRTVNPDARAETLVYKRACPGFAYYIRQQEDFSKDLEEQVRYLPDMGMDEESIKESLDSLFDSNWPDMLYVAATHFESDYPVLVAALEHEGYQRKEVYNNKGELLFLSK